MSNWIREATNQSFQTDVIEPSYECPVLVDFWAPWCGPCKTLTPTLEAAVEALGGAVHLVKVNVDENQEIAGKFQIQGIPAVKAIFKGQIVDEFAGAMDRAAVDAFIERILPSQGDRSITNAQRLLADRQYQEAIDLLAPVVEQPEHRDKAVVLLANAYVAQRQFAQALATLEKMPRDHTVETHVAHIRMRIDLLEAAGDKAVEPLREAITNDPSQADKSFALAGVYYRDAKYEEALEHLIQMIQAHRKYKDDAPRRAMLAIFEEIGSDDPLVRDYRRKMQIYL